MGRGVFKLIDEKERGFGRPKGIGNKGQRMLTGKCDVRLDAREEHMLNYLAERNEDTRSGVMRKALRDYFKFNTEE